MKINDELLERLGVYFVFFDLHERYQITFEKFIEMWEQGLWKKS